MSKWEKRMFLLLPGAAIVTFVIGDISMSKYGLDPPYIYFEVGAWLKMTSFAITAVAIVFALFVAVRHIVKGRKRAEPNA